MRIDGKALAAARREATAEADRRRVSQGLPVPVLAVILVGDDPASQVYVRNKENACRKAGIEPRTWRLPADTSGKELLDLIETLNRDQSVHGILVQMPLPAHLDEQAVIAAIDPDKDVDGLHPVNAGRLANGLKGFVPCTPQGAIALLEQAGLADMTGLKAVVVGRSVLVGKPMAQLLLNRNATVTICHSRTKDLAAHVAEADILVAAVGQPELIRGDWIKDGAYVIDVGINRVDGHLVGDVQTEAAENHAAAITPVPGGCGPMTVQMLLENTLLAALLQDDCES